MHLTIGAGSRLPSSMLGLVNCLWCVSTSQAELADLRGENESGLPAPLKRARELLLRLLDALEVGFSMSYDTRRLFQLRVVQRPPLGHLLQLRVVQRPPRARWTPWEGVGELQQCALKVQGLVALAASSTLIATASDHLAAAPPTPPPSHTTHAFARCTVLRSCRPTLWTSSWSCWGVRRRWRR